MTQQIPNITVVHTDHIIPAFGDKPAQPMPDLLTREEVIRVFRMDQLSGGLSETLASGHKRVKKHNPQNTIRYFIEKGRLKTTQIGAFKLFTRESVLECIKQQQKE